MAQLAEKIDELDNVHGQGQGKRVLQKLGEMASNMTETVGRVVFFERLVNELIDKKLGNLSPASKAALKFTSGAAATAARSMLTGNVAALAYVPTAIRAVEATFNMGETLLNYAGLKAIESAVQGAGAVMASVLSESIPGADEALGALSSGAASVIGMQYRVLGSVSGDALDAARRRVVRDIRQSFVQSSALSSIALSSVNPARVVARIAVDQFRRTDVFNNHVRERINEISRRIRGEETVQAARVEGTTSTLASFLPSWLRFGAEAAIPDSVSVPVAVAQAAVQGVTGSLEMRIRRQLEGTSGAAFTASSLGQSFVRAVAADLAKDPAVEKAFLQHTGAAQEKSLAMSLFNGALSHVGLRHS